MVATATTARAPRAATPARWQKALQRAFDSGIRILRIDQTGAYVVTSASEPGTAYETDGTDCGCQAWLAGDPVCLHRALYWHERGVLDFDDPTPPSPAASASSSTDDRAAADADFRRRYPGWAARAQRRQDVQAAVREVEKRKAAKRAAGCQLCGDTRRVKEPGFDGATMVPCPRCTSGGRAVEEEAPVYLAA